MRLWFSVVGVTLLVLGVLTTSLPSTPALAQSSGEAFDDFAVGIIVDTTNPRSMAMAREGGFTHAKMIVNWARLEPRRGRYTFRESSENDLDNVMKAARGEDMKLVVRVDGAPDWAGGKPSKADTGAVEAFYAAMAAHGKGAIVAYEVLNEPNLPFEWGGDPSPSGYAQFVKAAYRGVKKGDANALVIAGGLSPAAQVDDLEFLRGMYAAGVKGSMDVVAIHNYGGNFEPETDPGSCGICFRRAELYRQIMVEQGDGNTPLWGTEFGWLLDSGKNMGQYDWMRVSAEKQAEYVVRSFQYAQRNWPWMTGLLLSNLDASTSPYHTAPQDGMPWFAILNKDHSPRPAWKAVKAWREQELARGASRPRLSAAAQAASPTPVAPTPEPTLAPTATLVPALEPTPEPSAAPLLETPAAQASPATAALPEPPAASPTALIRLRITKTGGTGANLRAEPRPDARVIAILLDDTQLDVVGEDVKAGGVTWKNVRTTGSTSDGVTGWVSAQYLLP
ncbi:MAG: cellulase family glycosylhydrolase [Chloroflexi bacterium]|nr:cellulase family glycosylhydrolase [Chloroflexota bacterium]